MQNQHCLLFPSHVTDENIITKFYLLNGNNLLEHRKSSDEATLLRNSRLRETIVHLSVRFFVTQQLVANYEVFLDDTLTGHT